jgi:hypothetical protein
MLPHLLMNALLNKYYQICYHTCKLEIMYFMDMSYANTFVQGWINWFFDWLIDLIINYTSLYCVVDKRKHVKISCTVIFIMITKTYNKIREYLWIFTGRIYTRNLFPLTSDPDMTVATVSIHLTYFPCMSLNTRRRTVKDIVW